MKSGYVERRVTSNFTSAVTGDYWSVSRSLPLHLRKISPCFVSKAGWLDSIPELCRATFLPRLELQPDSPLVQAAVIRHMELFWLTNSQIEHMIYNVFFLELNQATGVNISIRFTQNFSLLNGCSTIYSLLI
jgi:hypothetical protein